MAKAKVQPGQKRAGKLRRRLKRRAKTTDSAAATPDELQAFLGEVDTLSLLDNASDFRKLIDKVLKEDFTDTVTVNGKEVHLKVLKAGPAQRVAKAVAGDSEKLMAQMSKPEDSTTLGVISSCADGLAKATALLLPMYGMDDMNDPEKIMEELELSEIQNLCHAQLRVQERADFLLDPLRPICGITRIGLTMTRQMTERSTQPTSDTEASQEKPDSV